MGFFDNAFKNEDLGAAKPAGGAQKKTVEVKVLGKPMQALPGQRLKDVVRASRAPISCGPPRPDRAERPLPSAARAAVACRALRSSGRPPPPTRPGPAPAVSWARVVDSSVSSGAMGRVNPLIYYGLRVGPAR